MNKNKGQTKTQTKDRDKCNMSSENVMKVIEMLESKISKLENPVSHSVFKSDKIHYFEGLISKQLNLYTWCEEKVSTLATINAIMLTAAMLFAERVKDNIALNEKPVISIFDYIISYVTSHFHITMVLFMVLPIFISLAITLWHIIPKMSSGKFVSPQDNPIHRSVVGIRSFDTWQKYKDYLDTLTEDKIFEQMVRQIYGMNKNIWKNQLSIKWAVRLDLIGLIGFLFIMVILFMSDKILFI